MATGPLHTYCVDGTNVVRGCYGYGGPHFQEQEEADSLRLVAALAQVCASLGARVEIDVFFDGARRPWPAPGEGNLRVRFTHEVEADEMILDRVRSRRYGGGGSVIVVTADSELGRRVSEEGGRWLRIRPGAPMETVVRSIEKRFSR